METRRFGISTFVELACHILFWMLAIVVAINTELTTDLQVGDSLNPSRFYYRMPINIFVFYTNFFVLIPAVRSRSFRYRASLSVLLITLAAGLESLLDASNRLSDPTTELLLILLELFAINFLVQGFYWFLSTLFRRNHDRAEALRRSRELGEENARMELQLLKSQLNPHFLFNVLNTLYVSAYEHGDKPTATGISKLSDLLRYFLYETNDQQVAIENEVECLRNYIDLQKMRFLDDVAVSMQIEGDYADREVAPFLFVTLLENAYKHGVRPGQHCEIDVSLRLGEQALVFEIENDVVASESGNAGGDAAGGLGLENLRRRLELLYPHRHRLRSSVAAGRFTTSLELKWL